MATGKPPTAQPRSRRAGTASATAAAARRPASRGARPRDAGTTPVASSRLDHAEVGAQLRRTRKGRGLTLQNLSDRSGIAVSTISKAERGEIALTYDKFASLARALSLDFDQIFGRTRAIARGPVQPSFTANGEHTVYETALYDYGVLAGDLAGKRMVPSRGRIKARSLDEFPDYIRHAGEEFVFVIADSLRLCLEDGKTFSLEAGDSLYFDSGVGHAYLATGSRDADVLVCCVLDGHGLHSAI